MSNLPSRSLSSTRSDHLDDHNELHAFHNLIDAKGDLIVGTAADTAGRLAAGTTSQILAVLSSGSLAWITSAMSPQSFFVTGTLTVQTGAGRLYNDSGVTLTILSVRASVGTAPTGSSVLVDVNKGGTTLFTTQANRPAIAVSTNTSGKATPDVTTWEDGTYLSADIDQIGSTIAGSDLTVQVQTRV